MSTVNEKESRHAERFTNSIKASVKARKDEDTFWKEDTALINFSRIGASFYIRHKCQVGQLVSLLFPMPKHLRLYDLDEIKYRVWGLVQHCNAASGDEPSDKFHTGVAFIGKSAPASYYQNPQQTYRISGLNEDGLWKVAETERPFVIRKETRFPVSLEVSIKIFNEEGILIEEEKTLTENISFGGALIFSNLSAAVGNQVQFTCETYNFSAPAIIRHRNFNEVEIPDDEYKHSKIHLEFIDSRFPLEQVKEI